MPKDIFQIVSIHKDPWSSRIFNTRQEAERYLHSDPEVKELGSREIRRIFRIEQREYFGCKSTSKPKMPRMTVGATIAPNGFLRRIAHIFGLGSNETSQKRECQ